MGRVVNCLSPSTTGAGCQPCLLFVLEICLSSKESCLWFGPWNARGHVVSGGPRTNSLLWELGLGVWWKGWMSWAVLWVPSFQNGLSSCIILKYYFQTFSVINSCMTISAQGTIWWLAGQQLNVDMRVIVRWHLGPLGPLCLPVPLFPMWTQQVYHPYFRSVIFHSDWVPERFDLGF